MSSMLSAPAAIPATRQPTFTSTFARHGPPTPRCLPARTARPARSARPVTGTRPARDTRFASSNDACVLPRSCDIALDRCPLQLGDRSFNTPYQPSSEGTSRIDAPEKRPYLRGGSRLSIAAPDRPGGLCQVGRAAWMAVGHWRKNYCVATRTGDGMICSTRPMSGPRHASRRSGTRRVPAPPGINMTGPALRHNRYLQAYTHRHAAGRPSELARSPIRVRTVL
jgi:hypothetical protein